MPEKSFFVIESEINHRCLLVFADDIKTEGKIHFRVGGVCSCGRSVINCLETSIYYAELVRQAETEDADM